MSIFQDQMNRDLDVFFNTNEFAGPHNINGTNGVICILEEEDIRSLRPGLSRFEGTYKNTLLLQIKKSDWQWDEPVYNDLVTVDNIQYTLRSTALVGGQYEMLLQAIE
jgi:hypothetical protein